MANAHLCPYIRNMSPETIHLSFSMKYMKTIQYSWVFKSKVHIFASIIIIEDGDICRTEISAKGFLLT